MDAAFLRLNRNATQKRSRKRQQFHKSKEYKKLTPTERQERLNAIYEEINRERDIAKAKAIEEFAQEETGEMDDGETENDTAIAREPEDMLEVEDEDEESQVEDESEDMNDDEDGIEDEEEYDEIRKNAIGQTLEESIKAWKIYIKRLESRVDPDEEINESINTLSDLSDYDEEEEDSI